MGVCVCVRVCVCVCVLELESILLINSFAHMLAQVLAMALCLSVCHKSELYEMAKQIGLVFGMGAFCDLSYTVL